tara:strand:- start:262 stop:1206 length:945 start_codon:yes stop_codon:yes gene_type:complete
MGYRSNGYFIIPAQYSAELGRRVVDYLADEKAKRVKDKAQADKDGSHYIYASTDPWNPLSGFDSIIEMKNNEGDLFHQYVFDGWKWYEGYNFPGIVERLLYEISWPDGYLLDSPEDTFLDVDYTPIYHGDAINLPTLIKRWTAIEGDTVFVRKGEDWNDVVVEDSTEQVWISSEIDGAPYSEKVPQTLLLLNGSDVEDHNKWEYERILDKLDNLSPLKVGEPWQEGDRFFYWDNVDPKIWKKITEIFSVADRVGASGWGLMMDNDMMDELHVNGASYWDDDVYPSMYWDDSGLKTYFMETGNILRMEDVFPEMF